jgi:hypothetical protein
MKLRPLAVCWLTAATLASQAGLSADELSTFQELKQKYHAILNDAGKPLYDAYQKKLIVREKAAVARRDYDLAAKLKDEREAAAVNDGQASLSPIATLETDGSVTMTAPMASLGGGVNLDKEKSALTGWTSASAFARWRLPIGLKTGGYDVELTYSSAGGGGSFVVKEDTYSLKREAKDSGSWASFRPEVCGTLHVKSSSQSLQISAATVAGEGLFYLQKVRLLPTSAAGS